MKIHVQNRVDLPFAEVRSAISAINKQIKMDFAPYWDMSAGLSYQRPSSEPPDKAKDAILYLTDITIDGALGFHDWSPDGIPFGIVDPNISKQAGEDWATTLSHEALELILDSIANVTAEGPHPTKGYTVFHWYEACDACQNDTYTIDGVQVSNFVLPPYFTRQEESRATNFLGNKLPSFGVRPGGYIGYYDPKLGNHTTYMARNDARANLRWRAKTGLGSFRRAGKRIG